MTPDFEKIQAGMTSGLNKTTRVKNEKAAENSEKEVSSNGLSFRSVDMGTGAAGRSSVKMDNIDTDLAKFDKSYKFAEMTNRYIDDLVKKGYSLEDATMAVYKELGVN